ncbi:MAG: family 43 glycosylhydrolase [Bacteroidaceae bacterium]|nr:family 43 glycosylhydrolase [Bacteroidaceae bacterium]
MKGLLLTIVALMGTATGTWAYDGDSIIWMKASQMGAVYKTTSASRVSVHDPSIVVDKNTSTGAKTYYIFGSHRACARTTDMKNWTSQSWNYGVVQANGSVTSTTNFAGVFKTNQTKKVKVLKDGVETEVTFGNFDCEAWRYTQNNPSLGGNQWAPDVLWNPHMGKWCMYMSLNGDNWRSVIAMLTADKITGPYVYQGPVVYSGFQWSDPADQTYKKTDLELVIGTQTSLPARYNVGGSWGRRWPNNIDPCVFFDEEGELWMAYGSWSGGIFMLKLDKTTGLRDYTTTYPGTNNNSDGVTSDPYFGKKIAGGYYVSGEGAYIEHIGNYYYLFVTHGGLEASKGYEMHYYRSKNPNGPYTDGSSTSAIFPSYMMNYGPSAATTRGMKIVGSHQWDTMKYAEMSQGHNSVLLDDDGRAYLIYHTRFNSGNEGFEDRVHQLFVNEKGWLVASPFEFNGLTGVNAQFTQGMIDSTEICTKQQIIGTYQVMMHPYKVDYANNAFSTPGIAVLKTNGSITGDYIGTWRRKAGTSYITLKIRPKGTSSTDAVEYYGVVVPQVFSGTNATTVAFTAISSAGVSVWGSNMDGNYAVDYNYTNVVKDNMPVTARQLIKTDIDLSIKGLKYGASVSWTSDQPDLFTDEGKLMVPYEADGDTAVVVGLNCIVQKDNYAYSYKRQVRIRTFKSNLPVKEDVNRDGIVDTQDVLCIYQYIQNGSLPIEGKTEGGCDVNGDGIVDTQDVLMIYQHILMQ